MESLTKEALAQLYKRRNFGIKLGLDLELSMLEKLGNPHTAYQCVHVAGTNGKGSVCAIIDAVLRKAGYRVGVYTSPHLVRFHERMRISGSEIGDKALAALIEQVERVSSLVQDELDREPTFFECATAMAFEHFRKERVEIAVLETGMGGRLDATNVVTPVVSVITNIELEHTEHLGKDIESVSREKCGIIKRGRPVVCGRMAEEAFAVVREVAAREQSNLINSQAHVSIALKSRSLSGQKVRVETGGVDYGTLVFPLLGVHQLENLATAVAALETLSGVAGLAIDEEDIKSGVPTVEWPGRCQVVKQDPPVIVDGAHNPAGASALAETLSGVLTRGGRSDRMPVGLVVGMCSDKDLRGFLKPFAGLAVKLWAVPIRDERNMPPDGIVRAASEFGLAASEAKLHDAVIDAVGWAENSGGAVCVTGSLFLVGEFLESLHTWFGEGRSHGTEGRH